MSEQTEQEYLIERLSKLLAEISVIVNGPQPMGVLWSYADLPEKVRALKDAAALNAAPQPQAEPVAWIVYGAEEDGEEAIQFACETKQQGFEHIHDQFAEGVHDAALWVVRPVYAAPQPQASAERPG